VIIRPVAAGDFDQWLPLWDAYNAFYGRSGPTALPRSVSESTWARFLDPDEPVHALVADREAQILGIAHYLFHASTTAVEQVCYLQDLLTLEQERGRGVGRALIEAVAEQAAEAGASRLYWHTHHTNATARALYDKVATETGFLVYARKTARKTTP
jgi:GNAT superfamily N-acetyltransferase